MATVKYWGLTGVKGDITGLTLSTTTVDQLITSIATDEGLSTEYYHISLSTDPSKNDITYGDSSTKLDAMGFTDGCTVYCTPNQGSTKEYRQIQKLDIAQRKRLGGLSADSTQGDYYRILNTYNRDLLPTKYSGNTVVDNANTGGLYPGRPWITEASNLTLTLRSFLSGAGQTAYDAASADSFFAVSQTDYDAVVAGVASTSTLGPSDADFSGASGSAFAGNYLFTADQSRATVPAGNYIIGFRAVTEYANQQWSIYGGATFRSTSPAYSQISTTSPSTGATLGTYYYLRKAPAVQAATTYIAIFGTQTLTMTTNNSYLTVGSAYALSPFTSWTAWVSRLPKLQVLITPTVVV